MDLTESSPDNLDQPNPTLTDTSQIQKNEFGSNNFSTKENSPASVKNKFKKPTLFIIALVAILLLVALTVFALYFFVFKGPKEKLKPVPISSLNVQRVLESGKIKIGTDATYPPMEFHDTEGNLIGYDVDLGNRLAEELSLGAEFVIYSWDDIFTSLENGEIDVIISSVSITDERKIKYDFSDPYINAGQVIVTKKEETKIKDPIDLSGKRVAVQKGTTNEEEALKYTSRELVLSFDDFISATEALNNGKADAIISDLTNAKGTIDTNPDLKIASDPFTSEFYGIVFRKNEADLVAEVNSALNALRQRGILVFLKQKWLE